MVYDFQKHVFPCTPKPFNLEYCVFLNVHVDNNLLYTPLTDATQILKVTRFDFKGFLDVSPKLSIKRQTVRRRRRKQIGVRGFFYRHLQWDGPSLASGKGCWGRYAEYGKGLVGAEGAREGVGWCPWHDTTHTQNRYPSIAISTLPLPIQPLKRTCALLTFC